MKRSSDPNLGALKNAPLPGDWAEYAVCKGMAPTDGRSEHPFFPGKGEKLPTAVCDRCPVEAYCRTYALRYPLQGVWGGMSEVERKRIRRRRREVA